MPSASCDALSIFRIPWGTYSLRISLGTGERCEVATTWERASTTARSFGLQESFVSWCGQPRNQRTASSHHIRSGSMSPVQDLLTSGLNTAK